MLNNVFPQIKHFVTSKLSAAAAGRQPNGVAAHGAANGNGLSASQTNGMEGILSTASSSLLPSVA